MSVVPKNVRPDHVQGRFTFIGYKRLNVQNCVQLKNLQNVLKLGLMEA